VLVDADDTRHLATLLNPAFLREQGISVPDWLAQAFPG
jgi:cysteine synthase